MGQRSQIFINVDYKNTDYKNTNVKYLVARYFQWNYAERMVSRCRGIIEWLLAAPQFLGNADEKKILLGRICDVNWDFHDIVMSQDIIKEYVEDGYWDTPYKMFTGQDNNDGKLYINVEVINSNEKTKCEIKYCFADYADKYLGNATNYLNWNTADYADGPWKKSFEKNELKYTLDNIKYISKHAKLMTEEEYKKFIHAKYSDYDFVKARKEKKLKEKNNGPKFA